MSNSSGIPYRLFWTWDHSTNWFVNTLGAQNCGVGNEYVKNPEWFEKDGVHPNNEGAAAIAQEVYTVISSK